MILRSCVILWNERFKGGDWELLCKDYERQMSGRGWSSPGMKGAVLWSGGLTSDTDLSAVVLETGQYLQRRPVGRILDSEV